MTKPRQLPHDRVVPGDPPELIVYDRLQPCPYLPERIARMPLRIPARLLHRSELEQRLETGDRRQGIFLYRTSCPGCHACEPIRIEEALSAVYCYYDPVLEKLGIGTYSVLKQIELCKSWELRYLYLGLYISDSERMRYKARFLPHQRRIDGAWQ